MFQSLVQPLAGYYSGTKSIALDYTKNYAKKLTALAVHNLFHNNVITISGEVFKIPAEIEDLSLSLIAGRYERPEIQVLKRWFKPADIIIEVGANIGVVSRYAFNHKLKSGGRYVCVEPNPRVMPELILNMFKCNNRSDKIYSIENSAIAGPGQEGQVMDFSASPDLGSGLTQYRRDTSDAVHVPVPVKSLSSIMKRYAYGEASLICDAEGAEIGMAFEDPKAFSRINQIAIELHGPQITGRRETPEMMVDRFRELGFVKQGQIHNTYYLNRVPSLGSGVV